MPDQLAKRAKPRASSFVGVYLLALGLFGCQSPITSPVSSASPTPAPVRKKVHVVVHARATPASERTPASKKTPAPEPTRDLQLALTLPGPENAGADLPPHLEALRRTASTAAEWRQLADQAVKLEHFAVASHAYAREAAIYRRIGDTNAARLEELKAARYQTDIELYRQVPPAAPRELARLEPPSGCYVGAFIDRDDRLQSHVFGDQRHGDIGQFNSLTGKKHASFFTYLQYGRPFPARWADYVKEHGAIPHLAWEPRSLSDVKNDAYLERFMEDVRRFDHPIFLRFAGEMNGSWTPYHGNPAAYRQAFRTVYQASRRAPKAAMIWCPNAIPSNNLDQYYPGDDATDWVGVNLYSVLYLNNDRRRPGDWIHPADLVEPVYRKYAARKPIAIGEYAASHQSSFSEDLRQPQFAKLKMAQLYESLPVRFPRLKLISWYDCNNLVKARPGRQLNNYQLTDMPDILDAYEATVTSGYFIGLDEQPQWRAQPLSPAGLPRDLKLRVWARSYMPDPRLYARLDGKLVWSGGLPEPPAFELKGLKPGSHKLEVLLYDPRGRFVKKIARNLRIL